MSKLVLASLCFSLFTSLALAKELIFATEPDGGAPLLLLPVGR